MSLENLQQLVDELNNTNSSLEKKNVLKKYPQCQELLKYTYNPLWQYYVTSETCQKRSDLNNDLFFDQIHDDIIDLLNDLKERKITGHDAISAVNSFVNLNREYSELIYLIIDRNLKTRTDAKIINKVFPKLVPQFDVALANKLDDKTKKLLDDDKWFISHKMDGIRVVTVIDEENNIKFYSRKGKEFDTLDVLKEEISKLNLKNKVLDGEVCIMYDDVEDFKSIVSQIKRKDFTIKNPCYKMFDYLTLDEFDDRKSERILSERYEELYKIIPKNNSILQILEQYKFTEESFALMQQRAQEKNWEGLILRRDTVYQGKRSNDLLKVKKFFDAEYKVIDITFGVKPILVDGKMVEKETLANVIIEHKNNKVGVGSGFSDEQRLHYHKHPDEIIDKTITVQYFEETTNKEGGISLRFPIIKHIFENGRDV